MGLYDGRAYLAAGGDAALRKRYAVMQQIARSQGVEELPVGTLAEPGFFLKTIDFLSRGLYAVAGTADVLLGSAEEGETIPSRVLQELFGTKSRAEGGRESFREVLAQNYGEGGRLSDLVGENMITRKWDPTARGTVALSLDIFADPLTYWSWGAKGVVSAVSRGGVVKVSKGGMKGLQHAADFEIGLAARNLGKAQGGRLKGRELWNEWRNAVRAVEEGVPGAGALKGNLALHIEQEATENSIKVFKNIETAAYNANWFEAEIHRRSQSVLERVLNTVGDAHPGLPVASKQEIASVIKAAGVDSVEELIEETTLRFMGKRVLGLGPSGVVSRASHHVTDPFTKKFFDVLERNDSASHFYKEIAKVGSGLRHGIDSLFNRDKLNARKLGQYIGVKQELFDGIRSARGAVKERMEGIFRGVDDPEYMKAMAIFRDSPTKENFQILDGITRQLGMTRERTLEIYHGIDSFLKEIGHTDVANKLLDGEAFQSLINTYVPHMYKNWELMPEAQRKIVQDFFHDNYGTTMARPSIGRFAEQRMFATFEESEAFVARVLEEKGIKLEVNYDLYDLMTRRAVASAEGAELTKFFNKVKSKFSRLHGTEQSAVLEAILPDMYKALKLGKKLKQDDILLLNKLMSRSATLAESTRPGFRGFAIELMTDRQINSLVREGAMSEGTGDMVRWVKANVDDPNTRFEIFNLTHNLTASEAERIGLTPEQFKAGKFSISGATITTLDDNVAKTVISLLDGAEADTVAKEWMRRGWNLLDNAERRDFSEYFEELGRHVIDPETGKPFRSADDFFAQEGSEYLLGRIAGDLRPEVRGIYDKLREIFNTIRRRVFQVQERIVEGDLPQHITQLYDQAISIHSPTNIDEVLLGQERLQLRNLGVRQPLGKDTEGIEHFNANLQRHIKNNISVPLARSEVKRGQRIGTSLGTEHVVSTKSGKIIGTELKPSQLGTLRTSVARLAADGSNQRFWYEASSEEILAMTGGNVELADKFAQVVAVYSGNNSVDGNMEMATKAWNRWLSGKPVRGVRSQLDDDKVQNILDGKYSLSDATAEKIVPFYKNLTVAWNPEVAEEITVDVWMGRAFKVGDTPNTGQKRFVKQEVRRLQQELTMSDPDGHVWTPQQVQAAIWVAEKKAAGRYDWDRNLSDVSRSRYVQLSWESINEGDMLAKYAAFKDLSFGERMELHVHLQHILEDESGVDVLAKEFGLLSPGDLTGTGTYIDNAGNVTVNPVSQTRALVGGKSGSIKKDRALDPTGIAVVEAYLATVGRVMGQESMAWNHLFPQASNKFQRNGMYFDIENLSEREARALTVAMRDAFGDSVFIASDERGFRLVRDDTGRFGVGTAENKLNNEFRRKAEVVVAEALDEREGYDIWESLAQSGYFEGGANGQGYKSRASAAGLEDLHDRLVAKYAPIVERAKRDFASKQGWEHPRPAPAQRTGEYVTIGHSSRVEGLDTIDPRHMLTGKAGREKDRVFSRGQINPGQRPESSWLENAISDEAGLGANHYGTQMDTGLVFWPREHGIYPLSGQDPGAFRPDDWYKQGYRAYAIPQPNGKTRYSLLEPAVVGKWGDDLPIAFPDDELSSDMAKRAMTTNDAMDTAIGYGELQPTMLDKASLPAGIAHEESFASSRPAEGLEAELFQLSGGQKQLDLLGATKGPERSFYIPRGAKKVAQHVADTTKSPEHKVILEHVISTGALDDVDFAVIKKNKATGKIDTEPIRGLSANTVVQGKAVGNFVFIPTRGKRGSFRKITLLGTDLPVQGTHGINETTITHEVLHAGTYDQYIAAKQAPSSVSVLTHQAAMDLDSIRSHVIRHINSAISAGTLKRSEISGSMRNALSATEELITWGFTDPSVQAALKKFPSIGIAEKNASLWDDFVAAITKMFGLSDKLEDATLLDDLISATGALGRDGINLPKPPRAEVDKRILAAKEIPDKNVFHGATFQLRPGGRRTAKQSIREEVDRRFLNEPAIKRSNELRAEARQLRGEAFRLQRERDTIDAKRAGFQEAGGRVGDDIKVTRAEEALAREQDTMIRKRQKMNPKLLDEWQDAVDDELEAVVAANPDLAVDIRGEFLATPDLADVNKEQLRKFLTRMRHAEDRVRKEIGEDAAAMVRAAGRAKAASVEMSKLKFAKQRIRGEQLGHSAEATAKRAEIAKLREKAASLNQKATDLREGFSKEKVADIKRSDIDALERLPDEAQAAFMYQLLHHVQDLKHLDAIFSKYESVMENVSPGAIANARKIIKERWTEAHVSPFGLGGKLQSWKEIEIPNAKGEVEKWEVPEGIADDLMGWEKRYLEAPEVKGLLRIFDWATNAFKAGVTVPFPAFHARNGYSNIFQVALDIGLQAMNPERHLEALRVMAAMAGPKARKLFPEGFFDGTLISVNNVPYTYEQIASLAKANQIKVDFDTLAEIIKGNRSMARASGNKLLRAIKSTTKPGREAGAFIETEARMMHFVTLLRRGYSPRDAAAQMKKYLFDYDNLSYFEKNYMRRIIPFYTWNSKNIRLMAHEVARKPGLINNLQKPLNQRGPDSDMLPEYVRGDLQVRLEPGAGKVAKFLTGIDLPITAIDVLFSGSLEKTMRNAVSLLNPLLKAPLELAFDQDAFAGRKIHGVQEMRKMGPILEKMPLPMRKYFEVETYLDKDNEKRYLANGTKVYIVFKSWALSRFMGTAAEIGTMFKEDEDVLKWWKLMTGLHLREYDLDEAQKKLFRARYNRLEDEMIKRGLMRQWQLTTPRDDVKAPKKNQRPAGLFG